MYSRSDKIFMVAMVLLAILTGIGVGIVLSPSAPPGLTTEVLATGTVTPIAAAVTTPGAQELAGASPDATAAPPRPATAPPTPAVVTTPEAQELADAPPATTATPPRPATAPPTPTAPATPTARPTATPAPQPTPDPAAVVALEQIQAATAALRSGSLEAVTEQRDGGRTTEVLRFDLGDAQREPRLLRVTTTATTTTELLMVGDRAWQRQGPTTWTPVAGQPPIPAQVQAFLPDVAAATQPQIASGSDPPVVQWYAANTDTDVSVGLAAGEPVLRELRYVPRADGAALTVSYRSWNTFVDIIAPDGT
jgi:hypothetical protein